MRVEETYVPYLGYRTYVRVVVPDEPDPARAPLVLLHGGPGSTHNYFELLDPLADLDHRMLVMYDQLGCGRSWDDAMAARPDLWYAQAWVGELEEVRRALGLDRIHLLGQSWGGMLAIIYLCDQRPSGVRSVVLSSTLASAALWSQEGHRRLRYLTADQRDAILAAEASGNFSSPAYQAAIDRYMELFCAGTPSDEDPECLRRPKGHGRESYVAAWGQNELMPSGTLAEYDYSGRLSEIACPALVVSGAQDLCSPLVAKQMADGIPGARWELFAGCRHMCFAEDAPRYLALLQEWLPAHD